MSAKAIKRKFFLTGALVLMAGLLGAGQAIGQDLEPSDLATSEASEFVGEWTISMEIQGNQSEMSLTFADVGGKLAAKLVSQRRPEPIMISDIAKTDSGLKLVYEVDFGGQTANLTMELSLADGKISGTLGDDGGFFSAELAGVPAAAGSSSGGGAASIQASKLDSADFDGFMGSWTLSTTLRDQPVELTLQFIDVGGKLAAMFKAPFSPDPENITNIEDTDAGLKLEYEASFGPQTFTINVIVKLEGGALTGTFGDTSGFIKADFTGARSDVDLVASAPTVDQRERRRSRRRGAGSQARLTLQGSEIKVTYAGLKTDSEDFANLSEVAAGTVFRFVGGRATKLMTESDLVFGDIVIETENAAENYPGVYSLWLKKTDSGWNLLFNEHADIWGTQHEAEADVKEVPLTVGEADSTSEQFKLEVTEEGDGGLLKIVWGETQWTAKFKLGETTIAKASTD